MVQCRLMAVVTRAVARARRCWSIPVDYIQQQQQLAHAHLPTCPPQQLAHAHLPPTVIFRAYWPAGPRSKSNCFACLSLSRRSFGI